MNSCADNAGKLGRFPNSIIMCRGKAPCPGRCPAWPPEAWTSIPPPAQSCWRKSHGCLPWLVGRLDAFDPVTLDLKACHRGSPMELHARFFCRLDQGAGQTFVIQPVVAVTRRAP